MTMRIIIKECTLQATLKIYATLSTLMGRIASTNRIEKEAFKEVIDGFVAISIYEQLN
jgi:hypothetical protein